MVSSGCPESRDAAVSWPARPFQDDTTVGGNCGARAEPRPDGDHGRAPDGGRCSARPRPLPARRPARRGRLRHGLRGHRRTPAARGRGQGHPVRPARSGPERGRREALAAGRLDHPGVVAVFDAGEDERARYLVSELVYGRTVDELCAEGLLTDRDVLRIGLALCGALEHAHGRGVVHRDVKPQNVIVPDAPRSAAGVAKLADFGVAHLAGDDPLTRTGDVVGTLAYMAPEQAAGKRIDERADLYSLALVLYEALAGVNPVRAGSPAATARRVGTVLPPLRRSRKDLPEELCAAIDTALRPKPDERGTLGELADELAESLPEVSDEGGGFVAPHPDRAHAGASPRDRAGGGGRAGRRARRARAAVARRARLARAGGGRGGGGIPARRLAAGRGATVARDRSRTARGGVAGRRRARARPAACSTAAARRGRCPRWPRCSAWRAWRAPIPRSPDARGARSRAPPWVRWARGGRCWRPRCSAARRSAGCRPSVLGTAGAPGEAARGAGDAVAAARAGDGATAAAAANDAAHAALAAGRGRAARARRRARPADHRRRASVRAHLGRRGARVAVAGARPLARARRRRRLCVGGRARRVNRRDSRVHRRSRAARTRPGSGDRGSYWRSQYHTSGEDGWWSRDVWPDTVHRQSWPDRPGSRP